MITISFSFSLAKNAFDTLSAFAGENETMGGCCFSTPLDNNQQPPQQPQIPPGERKNDGFVNWPVTEFFLSDITTATNNFSSDEIISENAEESSNVVYKGCLLENLGFVAVKRFKKTPWDDPDYFTVPFLCF